KAQNRQQVIKALCLHIAHDCNLRCEYCFAGDGDYGTIAKSVMPPEVAKKAVDFLIKHSGNRHNLEIDFFGGEPTLNFDTVKQTVAYAKQQEKQHNKHIRFTLTTNGVLLDNDKISYINEHIDNVVLSLDGRKEVNDKMRKTASQSQNKNQNKSSYDVVVPKFLALVAARAAHSNKSNNSNKSYYVRGTFTAENLDFTNDVKHLQSLGFTQISVEPVIGPFSAKYSIKEQDVPIVCAEYEKLATEMAEQAKRTKAEKNGKSPKNTDNTDNTDNTAKKELNFFHFNLNLHKPPCAAKRITGCGAGAEYLAVTPEGNLFPCHQFVGDNAFCLGNLDDGIINTVGKFSECNIYNKPDCDACWAKYFCGGGCAANAYHLNNNIMQPDKIGCDLQRKRTECAIYLAVARAM
ncbi:MAG: SPASM domain-containing protein, partial [Defluviitaleaceae bacterium]|nr:SPASM domain-containing protein [Defluviitaleaceae bacterium]